MKKIKSILLNTEFPFVNRNKKNIFNIKNYKSKDLSSKSSFNRRNLLSEKNISSFKNKNPFTSTTEKNLQLINYYMDKNKNNSKSNRLYRTEIQTSQRIIRFPSSHRNKNYNSYNNRVLTSYYSSKNYFTIPRNSKYSHNKSNTIDTLDKCQTFINLTSLLGKRRSNKKIANVIYHLESMRTRKEYAELILKKSLLSYKSTHDTPFAHNLNTNFIIKEYERIKVASEKQKQRIEKYLIKFENLKNMNGEIYDDIDAEYLDCLKMKRDLKKLICNNEINIKEDGIYSMLKKYENKINYVYDVYNVPTFKNRLLKYNNEINYEIKHINELDCPNFINSKIWNYLNKKKIKIQYYKDKGIDNKLINENISTDINNKKNISKRINHEIHKDKIKEEEKVSKINNKKTKFKYSISINEEFEDYFINKRIYNINSFLASDLLKKVVYKKFC